MSALVQRTNADGLNVRYGVESSVDRTRGTRAAVEEVLIMDFDIADMTVAAGTGFYDADASGGETLDSYSDAIPFIPADSVITRAFVICTTACVGTAAMDIGLENKAGTVIDSDGIYDGLDLDSATVGLAGVGDTPIPNGVLVQNTTGTYDPDGLGDATSENYYVRPIIDGAAGSVTSGRVRLTVFYIAP